MQVGVSAVVSSDEYGRRVGPVTYAWADRGPWSIPQHVADLGDTLDFHGLGAVDVIGHSYPAVVTACGEVCTPLPNGLRAVPALLVVADSGGPRQS